MAAPRRPGFRAPLAGREFQPGSARDFALGFLTQFAQPTGAGPAAAAPLGGAAMGAAAPMAMGTHMAGRPGAGMPGMSGAMGMTASAGGMTGTGAMGGLTGAMGTGGQHSPVGGAATTAGYGPGGGGVFGSMAAGRRPAVSDAETGAGMDVGGGLAFTDAVTGLSLDVWVRTLVVHQAEGFTERGMSLSLGWDPTPSSPLGLTAKVAPSWGGSAQGGAEALWGQPDGLRNGLAPDVRVRRPCRRGGGLRAAGGWPLRGAPRVGLTTSPYGRDYRVGYGLGVLDRGKVSFELTAEAQRRETPMQGEASNGFLGRATLGW